MPIFPPRTDHGFTLVEVLVALVMLAVISALTARVLQGSLRVNELQRQELAAQQARANELALQFSGEREEPLVTLTPMEEEP